VLLLLLLIALLLAAGAEPASAARPNVVVIMTDDQTYADMAGMPHTRTLIGEAGATFERAYASYPLCCPSRATFLTGQYAHNHGVRTNTPPQGGYEALEGEHTLPVWLRAAGYDTSHVGKYLNGYGLRHRPVVPPGWTDWHGAVDKSTYQMWGYTLFENGEARTYGDFDVEDPALYQTDVLRDKALRAIEAHEDDRDPFFLSLAFVAPHGEVVEPGSGTQPYIRPAPRHMGRLFALRPPLRAPAPDAGKPLQVRRLRRNSPAVKDRIREDFQARRESLLAVDEAVAAIVAALERTGQLGSTYILFTSDNGFFQGEHGIAKGKYLAYEPSTHVPLLIRGPGITPGTVSRELISNADLAPTVLDAAGASADRPLDGRSLLSFARDPALRSDRPILHEGLAGGDIDRDVNAARPARGVGVYYAIRTDRFLYVMWRGGARELYDLARDPHELHSVRADPRYTTVKAVLTEELRRLRRCGGADCRLPVPSLLLRR
jgi:N-acetylglucosamine-6-sulfatase